MEQQVAARERGAPRQSARDLEPARTRTIGRKHPGSEDRLSESQRGHRALAFRSIPDDEIGHRLREPARRAGEIEVDQRAVGVAEVRALVGWNPEVELIVVEDE